FDFATTRERIARLAEQLEIVHGLLHEPRVDFAGTHYRLQDAPGLGRPDLTILVGGSAKPGTTGPAVRFADEYNCVFGTFDEARERKQRLDEACERGGRDPATLRYSLMAPLIVGRDDREVQESARRIAGRFGRDPKDVLERYADRGPVGTAGRVASRLRAFEAMGFERVMLQHLAHEDLDSFALTGRHVSP